MDDKTQALDGRSFGGFGRGDARRREQTKAYTRSGGSVVYLSNAHYVERARKQVQLLFEHGYVTWTPTMGTYMKTGDLVTGDLEHLMESGTITQMTSLARSVHRYTVCGVNPAQHSSRFIIEISGREGFITEAVTPLPQPRLGVCNECGWTMGKRTTTTERSYCYRECGLPDVRLWGIKVFFCPRCSSEVPVIPRMRMLHQLIARMLIEQPAFLSGPEVRYLRGFTGQSGQAFAALLRIGPEYLSRVENCRDECFGGPIDQLVRLVASVTLDDKLTRTIARRPPATAPARRCAFALYGTTWSPVGAEQGEADALHQATG